MQPIMKGSTAMKYIYHAPNGVKIIGQVPQDALEKLHRSNDDRRKLLIKINAERARTEDRESELALYAMWLQHALVPTCHVRMLMNVSRRQVM
jgi:hypothetical protein